MESEKAETVSVRDLRNNGGAVLARVAAGESLTVTRDGEPVAAVVPLPRRRVATAELITRRRHLPRVDVRALWSDLDEVLDPTL